LHLFVRRQEANTEKQQRAAASCANKSWEQQTAIFQQERSPLLKILILPPISPKSELFS